MRDGGNAPAAFGAFTDGLDAASRTHGQF